jgi:hypothetical protein
MELGEQSRKPSKQEGAEVLRVRVVMGTQQ